MTNEVRSLSDVRIDDRGWGRYVGIPLACPRNRERYTRPRCRGPEITVNEVNARFGSMIRRVEWAADRSRVKLDGVGFWVEMSVDAQAV
jgi:hypothetical protein